MAYARVSVTLPEALLTRVDRRAREDDRSRSWVVAEALRRWLEAAPGAAAAVAEPAPVTYGAAEVADARRQRLVAELKLTPPERLRRAEGLGRLARACRPRRTARAQIIGFDSYEDYYEWKKARRAGV